VSLPGLLPHRLSCSRAARYAGVLGDLVQQDVDGDAGADGQGGLVDPLAGQRRDGPGAGQDAAVTVGEQPECPARVAFGADGDAVGGQRLFRQRTDAGILPVQESAGPLDDGDLGAHPGVELAQLDAGRAAADQQHPGRDVAHVGGLPVRPHRHLVQAVDVRADRLRAALAADQLPLGHRHLFPGGQQPPGARLAAGAHPDDDHVEPVHRATSYVMALYRPAQGKSQSRHAAGAGRDKRRLVPGPARLLGPQPPARNRSDGTCEPGRRERRTAGGGPGAGFMTRRRAGRRSSSGPARRRSAGP
jgi:hypothetical protein